MTLLRNIILGLVLLLVTGIGWAVYLPASHPILERAGLLAPMRAMGIPVAEPVADAGGARRGGGGGVGVVAHAYAEGRLDDRISAIGTGQAQRAATITPEAAGRLTEILVQSGDFVQEGALIARLERETEQIAVERARILLEDAERTAARFQRLQDSGTATDVQIRESELAVRTAELNLREAEVALERRDIRAPFDGWIGIVAAEVGNQMTTSSELTRIDDRSVLLLDFNIPERFVGQIAPDDLLQATPVARPTDSITGKVRAIDSRVDQASRTLRIQGEIPNPDDRLRAGMAFAITIRLPGQTYPAVDPLAIQWGADGSFVWVADADDTAQQRRVEIMQRRDRAVLVRGDLAPGDRVIIEGVQNLRPGAALALAEVQSLEGLLDADIPDGEGASAVPPAVSGANDPEASEI